MIAAEREGRKIAIEIKSFAGTSLTADFHTAVGQFVNYRIALQHYQPERMLYLAVPIEIYKTYFARPFATMVVEAQAIKLLVYDPEREEIVAWQE